MATEQGAGIPFAVAHDMLQFRLLELPPEIVELMNGPSPPLLSIKSQAPSAPSTAFGTPGLPDAYAVLCTPRKTFQLRQVQTSNSLFVTRPAHGNEMPTPTTRAIASCMATLELHPSEGSAVTHLEQQLPLLDIADGLVDSSDKGRSKAHIFAHVPFSDAQCEQAWVELMAFETIHGGGQHSHRPSAKALAHVWKAINISALAEGIKLDSHFLTEEITKAVIEEQYPPELAVAICRHLASDDQDATGPWSCLDRTKTVAFVGKALLEARSGEPDYLIAEFLDTWKDSLPEAWGTDVALKMIDGAYHLTSTTTIGIKGSSPAVAVVPAPTKAGKWHEKFGKTRKR